MKNLVPTAGWTLAALLATASVAPADDYQCLSAGGCEATILTDGGARTVTFRQGDVVSTSNGWIVNTADGWSKVD